MIIENKSLSKTIFFAAAFLVFGFWALSAPKAQAAALSITSSSEFLSMCRVNPIDFTAKDGAVLIDGVTITLSGEATGTCTTVAGLCSITPSIIKGDVVVTAKKTGFIDGVLNFKISDNSISDNSIRKGASKEFVSEMENFCSNVCNDDISASDITQDCADSDCFGKTCYIGAQRGTCNNVSKTCVLPTGTLTLSASPTSVVAGNTTTITFTSNYDGVKITLSGLSTKDCTTDNTRRCSIDINPSSTGAISAIATKSGYTSPISSTTIQVTSANSITVTANPSSVIAGVSTNITFETNVKEVVITLSGKANGTCTTGVNSPFTCPISVTASSAGTINVVAAKTGTTPSLTPGTATFRANSPGTTGGGTGGTGAVGANGLTTASLSVIIGRMINWLLSIAAGLAILFIIIGGVYYVTAAGNDAQIETAKKMIAYSIIGLVFVIVSYSIVVTINSIITG